MAPASSAPRVGAQRVVVCCATLRLSELAPHSVNGVWLMLEAWKRANGVSVAAAGA